MLSPAIQRLILVIVIFLIVLKVCAQSFFEIKEEVEIRDLKQASVFEGIVEANSLWVDEDEEKKFLFYKNVPAFAPASNKIAAIPKSKTAICETDETIGQAVLCSLQQKTDDSPCDSDSLQHYNDFDGLSKSEKIGKNFTDWKILFARRDPIERLVDHFIDTCVREARPCFDCRLNLKCYLTIIHNVVRDLPKRLDLLNEDHRKYIPQNWYCQMETMSQRFTFVDYHFFANPTNPEFADAKRPDKWRPADLFEDPVSSYEKIQKYFTVFIHSRADVLDLVKKLYYWDYMMLKIPLPELKLDELRDYNDGWH